MILEKTVELLKQIFKYQNIFPPRISRIVIGEKYTGVEVMGFGFGMFVGVAYTMPAFLKNPDFNKTEYVKKIKDVPVDTLLEWSYGAPSIEKTIGIATVNAYSQYILQVKNPYKIVKEDLIEYLRINESTKITVIGLMKPLIRKVSKITSKITIVEDFKKFPEDFDSFLVKRDINQLKEDEIPTDVSICTGTTLLNNTMMDILNKFKRKTRKIVLLGPTASMLPDILFDYDIDIVGGMKIEDTDATMKVLEAGGGTKMFKQHGKKYNLIKE